MLSVELVVADRLFAGLHGFFERLRLHAAALTLVAIVTGASFAAFPPAIRPNAKHSPMLPPP
jgi:hypothetical protein